MTANPDTFTACITPFNPDRSFNEAAFRQHLRWIAAGGTGVYVLPHGAGEGLQVSLKERLQILSVAADELRGKAPVHAAGQGLGPSTEDFIEQAREIAATGVDAIQLFGPRPAYPSTVAKPPEVERYFRDCLDAVKHPFVISISNGAVPGVEPRPELMRNLVDTYPHLVGINMTVGNPTYLRSMIDAVKGTRATVRIGGPTQTLQLLAYGGTGILGLEGNLVPHFFNSIVADWKAGKANQAAESWRKLMLLSELLSRFGMPASTKAAMQLWGFDAGIVRKPFLDLDAKPRQELLEGLNRLGVKEWEMAAAKAHAN